MRAVGGGAWVVMTVAIAVIQAHGLAAQASGPGATGRPGGAPLGPGGAASTVVLPTRSGTPVTVVTTADELTVVQVPMPAGFSPAARVNYTVTPLVEGAVAGYRKAAAAQPQERLRSQRRQRELRAFILPVELDHAAVDCHRLASGAGAEQCVGQFQVGVYEPRTVAGANCVLHSFLVVPDGGRDDSQDLVHHFLSAIELLVELEPHHRQLEFVESPIAVPIVEQSLAQHAPQFPVLRLQFEPAAQVRFRAADGDRRPRRPAGSTCCRRRPPRRSAPAGTRAGSPP